MTNKELGAEMRKARERLGISQYRLLKDKVITGIAQLKDVEEGRRDVRLSSIIKILSAYGKELKIVDKE